MIRINFCSPGKYSVTVDGIETLLRILKAAGDKLYSFDHVNKREVLITPEIARRMWDGIQALENDTTTALDSVPCIWTAHYIKTSTMSELAGVVGPNWHYKDKSYKHIYWELEIGLQYSAGNPDALLPEAANHLLDVIQEMLS